MMKQNTKGDNVNSNPYSDVATRDIRSGASRSDVESSGSRRAYAMFYGLEANDLSRSSYAKCKESLISKPLILPQSIRSGAFKSENAAKQLNSLKPNENKLRENRMAIAGGRVLEQPAVDLNDPEFLRNKKKFFMLPSSHASKAASKTFEIHKYAKFIVVSLKQVSLDQNQQLNEIIGENSPFDKDQRMFYAGFTPKEGALGSRHFQNYKDMTNDQNKRAIDSSASSFVAAKNAFYGVEAMKSSQKLREVRTPSTIEDELPINQKFNRSVFDIGKKTTIKSTKEEVLTYGKSKKLFTDSMMTPADRKNGKLVYDILTCSYRKK